jgi:quercetin dioxygenase-like cupin family protein
MKRRDLIRSTGLCVLPAFAAGMGHLADSCLDESKATVTREPFGEIRVYYDGPTDQLKSMTAGSLRLKPGMTPHPPHQHPEEELMVVTEGTGEILVNGETWKVSPGTMMYCGGNHLHGIKNTGKASLLFYYYKWLR